MRKIVLILLLLLLFANLTTATASEWSENEERDLLNHLSEFMTAWYKKDSEKILSLCYDDWLAQYESPENALMSLFDRGSLQGYTVLEARNITDLSAEMRIFSGINPSEVLLIRMTVYFDQEAPMLFLMVREEDEWFFVPDAEFDQEEPEKPVSN